MGLNGNFYVGDCLVEAFWSDGYVLPYGWMISARLKTDHGDLHASMDGVDLEDFDRAVDQCVEQVNDMVERKGWGRKRWL